MEIVGVSEKLPAVPGIECRLAEAEVSENLEAEVRDALSDLKLKSDKWMLLEELQALMCSVSDHLDQKRSEQKAVYNWLLRIEENTRETIKMVRVIALFIAAAAGFWSVVGWWIWRDEIRSLFYVVASLTSHSISELLASMH
jgi:hypothetical protein